MSLLKEQLKKDTEKTVGISTLERLLKDCAYSYKCPRKGVMATASVPYVVRGWYRRGEVFSSRQVATESQSRFLEHTDRRQNLFTGRVQKKVTVRPSMPLRIR